MKQCSTCKRMLSLDDFDRNRAKKDGRQYACKECRVAANAAFYQRTKESLRKTREAAKNRVRDRNKRIVRAHLESNPCTDCGITDWRVLEFDHLSDKTGSIANMMGGHSEKNLRAEIDKCDVVCANCHRIRTYTRSSSWRLAPLA